MMMGVNPICRLQPCLLQLQLVFYTSGILGTIHVEKIILTMVIKYSQTQKFIKNNA